MVTPVAVMEVARLTAPESGDKRLLSPPIRYFYNKRNAFLGMANQRTAPVIEFHEYMVKPDEEQKVWRYLDFTKFLSLLDKNALFFSRIDRLTDKYEGAYAKPSVQRLKADLNQPEYSSLLPHITQENRRNFFVNCWHMNSHESAAMWAQYAQSNMGVAIQTTYKGLSESLRLWPYPLFAGKVTYIDYETDDFPVHNMYFPVFHKRKSFEHEKELRILHSHKLTEVRKFAEADLPPGERRPLPSPQEFGLIIPVDLEALVEQVYVAPTAPDWFRELVNSVLAKYELRRDPIRSDLDNDPVW